MCMSEPWGGSFCLRLPPEISSHVGGLLASTGRGRCHPFPDGPAGGARAHPGSVRGPVTGLREFHHGDAEQDVLRGRHGGHHEHHGGAGQESRR